MSNVKRIRVKILPPFTRDMRTFEDEIEIKTETSLEEFIVMLEEKGFIDKKAVLEDDNKLKTNVVIMINGIIIDDLKKKINANDRVVIMPLVYGGFISRILRL
jgi:molybdopterin converting factor small subunit